MVDRATVNEQLLANLRQMFADLDVSPDLRGLPVVRAPRERYIEIIQTLRQRLGFGILSHVCGAHYPADPEPFEVVVLLTNMALPAQVRVKVRAAGEPPTVPSLAAFWPAADWHERETFDMFGVRFDGHPDLRRIYLDESVTVHPLRKDFPVDGELE